MLTQWQQFESADGQRVEAQVFSPQSDTGDVILLCPGFPGEGATIFEQRHAATLVHEGFVVVVLRHAGMRLDSPHTPFLINNAHRLMLARRMKQTHLCGGPSTIDAWLSEPLVALEHLKDRYRNIHVIGNSFGALSAMWSMTEDGAPIDNISTLTLMAGAQGIHDDSDQDILKLWNPVFIESETIKDKVSLEPAENIVKTLAHVYTELPARVQALPDRIRLTYLVVERDEILPLHHTERFKGAIGGRGEIIMDDIDRAHPNHNLTAHHMPDYPTEYLIDIIEGEMAMHALAGVIPTKNN